MKQNNNVKSAEDYLKNGEVVWVSIYDVDKILRYLIITKGWYREEYELIQCFEDGTCKQIAKSDNPSSFNKYIKIKTS